MREPMINPFSIAGKVVVITGAVGNLGSATARLLQSAGAKTILVDRSRERVNTTYADLVGSPDHLLAGNIDLSNASSLASLVAESLACFGRIDALVNTVGAFRGGQPVHESELADWDFLFNVNLRTTLLCCRAFIPAMLARKSGKIVNVASRDGLAGEAGYAAYCVSKSAVLRLTESLAEELKACHLNVNSILPGTIDTPQNRHSAPTADFTKWVEPSAIAEVICFLLSDAARAINGAAIPIYGRA